MWICKKCNEENEDSFDSCWKCQEESEVGLKKSQIYHDEIGVKKQQDESQNVSKQTEPRGKAFYYMSFEDWFITFLIGCIPVVNIIMILVWAFGKTNKRQIYCQAMLTFFLLVISLVAVGSLIIA